MNQATRPLFSVDSNWAFQGNVWSISYLLKPQVRLQFLPEGKTPIIPDGFSDVFLFSPSEELKDNLKKEHKFKLEQIYNGELYLWKLEK